LRRGFSVPGLAAAPATMQLRVEAFNLFNTAHLAMTNDMTNPFLQTNNPLFGRVTSLRAGTLPRVIQLGAKFIF
jgi:hypothetical protein